MLQEASHIKNTVFFIFRYIQCLHLMYSEVAWVLVSSETQFQPQIILVPDYLPDYLSVSYDYNSKKVIVIDGVAEWLSKSDIRSCGQLIPKHLNSLTIMMTLTMGHWLQQWCFFHFFYSFLFFVAFLDQFDEICSTTIFKTTDTWLPSNSWLWKNKKMSTYSKKSYWNTFLMFPINI